MRLARLRLSNIFQLNMSHGLKTIILLLLILTGLASCRNAWNQDNEKTFYNACIDDAKTWAATPEQAAAYCNCIIPKIKQKYPDENEAIKQIDSLANDKYLQGCMDSLRRK